MSLEIAEEHPLHQTRADQVLEIPASVACMLIDLSLGRGGKTFLSSRMSHSSYDLMKFLRSGVSYMQCSPGFPASL